jgi:flagellar basal body-associated protein FliL
VQQKTPAGASVADKPKSGGSKVFLIILIIVVALAILAVGGYFIYKYAGKKLLNRITGESTNTETSTEKSDGKVGVKSVIETLMYPESEILDQKQEKDGVFVAELTLSSGDTVEAIKNYYLNLIKEKKWTITRQGTSEGYNSFYATFSDENFTDELDITKYEMDDYTTIRHQISGENLKADGIYVPSSGSNSSSTSATTDSSEATSTVSSGDYVISDSNTREISKSELISLTPWQLKVARNEIYARHGRPFVHKDLQCYFATKSWYSEDPNYDVSSISYVENKNIATIQSYEQEISSPLASHDSGCNTNQ